MDLQSKPSPRALGQHHKETMISLPPLQNHERLLFPATKRLALLSSQPARNCPTRNPGPDLSRKQQWKGGSRRAYFPAPIQFPKPAARGGWKERDHEGKMEEGLPGTGRQERAEADFDAKSGRDRKQDWADRKVAGVSDAFCKHHLSISALNLIIVTRATDSVMKKKKNQQAQKQGKGREE